MSSDLSLAASSAARLDEARERFFGGGAVPDGWLAPHISRSWQRSRDVLAAQGGPAPLAAARLRERRDLSRRLLDSAGPELDGLTGHAIDNGCVVIVSDADGVILEEFGSPDFLPKARRFALLPGVEWSETQCGTNAIGTALVEREPVAVRGGEHFRRENGSLGCAAAPIFTGRGDVAGVLDVSGDSVRIDSHALGLVRFASQQIEHRLLLGDTGAQVLRFHRNPALLGTAREGVILLADGQVLAANRIGLMLLGERWDTLLDRPIDRWLGRPWAGIGSHAGAITLADGRQLVARLDRRDARSTTVNADAAVHSRPTAPLAAAVAPDVPRRVDEAVGDVAVRQAMRVLEAGIPVLVTGETGSGKEVFARRLHAAGRRSGAPFVAVNCAALPETLIEAELFGYAEGAFTGARRRGSVGRIREADGGTLLLDEIGDMPLALQTRLLRVLEERVVSPLGVGRDVRVDFQLVCATHCDLAARVAEGRFRSDLLYRVNGHHVHLPPLRERSDRRDLILRLFADAGAASRHLRLADAAVDALDAYPWPGNVRELATTLKTLVALASFGDVIDEDALPGPIRVVPASAGAGADVPARPGMPSRLADQARDAIDRALAVCDGNVAQAARRLGVHRSTVYRHRARPAPR